LIFVDSNIPMYLIGAPHQLKTDSQLLLERSIGEGQRLVTDVEVLQEILHRYTAIDRRDAIEPAFEALLGIVDDVLPIDKSDGLRASQIVQSRHRLSARDAMHIAVMERYQIGRIMSFDQDFDRWPGIVRLFAV
jgi:predicted nucleic acid-binding protein